MTSKHPDFLRRDPGKCEIPTQRNSLYATMQEDSVSISSRSWRYSMNIWKGWPAYIGLQEELTDEASMNLIRSVQKESYLEAVEHHGRERDQYLRYRRSRKMSPNGPIFSRLMKGEQNLKRSSGQQTVNGEQRVILGVPIYQGGVVKGVTWRLLRSGVSGKPGF